jgi:hypothetical protein
MTSLNRHGDMNRLPHTRDKDVVAISAFSSWGDMMFSIENHDYVPTIRPTSPAHRRVRRALRKRGLRVWPPQDLRALVKIIKLTDTQAFWLSEYLNCSSDSSDAGVRLDAESAIETRTTVTMTAELAGDCVHWLDGTEEDHHDAQEFAHETYNERDFARRAIKKSFASLVSKIELALAEVA